MFASSSPAWQVAAFAPTDVSVVGCMEANHCIGLANALPYGVGDIVWSEGSDSSDERRDSKASSQGAASYLSTPREGRARRGRRSEAGMAKRRARQELRLGAMRSRAQASQALADSPCPAPFAHEFAGPAATIPTWPATDVLCYAVPFSLWPSVANGYSTEDTKAILLSAMPNHYED